MLLLPRQYAMWLISSLTSAIPWEKRGLLVTYVAVYGTYQVLQIAKFVGSQNLKDKNTHAQVEAAAKTLIALHTEYERDNAETADKMEALGHLQKIVDQNSSLKKITELCSKAMAVLFTDEEFGQALEDLGSEEVDDEVRVQ